MLIAAMALSVAGWQLDKKADPFTDKIELTAIGPGQNGDISLVAYCHPERGAIFSFAMTKHFFHGKYLRGGPRMVSVRFRVGKLPARDLIAYAFSNQMATIGARSNDFAAILEDLNADSGDMVVGTQSLSSGYITDTIPTDGAKLAIVRSLESCLRR